MAEDLLDKYNAYDLTILRDAIARRLQAGYPLVAMAGAK